MFTFPRFSRDPPPELEVGSGPDAAAAAATTVVKPPAPAETKTAVAATTTTTTTTTAATAKTVVKPPAETKTTVAATTSTTITTTTAQNSVAQISWKCTNDSELRRKIESSDNVSNYRHASQGSRYIVQTICPRVQPPQICRHWFFQ
eukprot:scaffold21207_cov198-Skeletonema_marinoi.AAC.4